MAAVGLNLAGVTASANAASAGLETLGLDGELDPSFGTGGTVKTPVGTEDRANAMVLQPDGKIVVCGRTRPGAVRFDYALARYNTDGTLDTTFGNNGTVVTSLQQPNGADDECMALALQADGKIVAAGNRRASGGALVATGIIRYNPDGSLDTSFGTGGIVLLDRGVDKAVVVQADGKIVCGGGNGEAQGANYQITRLNADGSPDATFGTNGDITIDFNGSGDGVWGLVLQPDGKIIAAGRSRALGDDDNFAVARLNTDGSLDTSFGSDGKAVADFNGRTDVGFAVALQTDGKIVVVGRALVEVNIYDFGIARFNTDGSLDDTFGNGGRVSTNFDLGVDTALAVKIQPDGRIVAAGISGGTATAFGLARYNPNGSLDTTFGNNGLVETFFDSIDEAHGLQIQADGKLVAAGTARGGPSIGTFAVARYLNPSIGPTAPASIAGRVTYGNAIGSPNPRPVSNVQISGEGSTKVSATTGFPGGDYTLTRFGTGAYTVTPGKAGGVNNITSFDAARIAQHAAGINPLTGSQLIVADVSGNGTISSFDAGQIGNYVVGSTPVGLTGTWSFTPANRTYQSVNSSITGADYSALLMGEVSGNWVDSGTRPVDRRLSAIRVSLPSFETQAGKEVTIAVNVEGVANKGIIAYEFDLRYDPSVMQPVAEPVDPAGTASRGLSHVINASEPGLLRVAVFGATPIDSDGLLLNLRFIATGAPGLVSPLILERVMFNEGDQGVIPKPGHMTITSAFGKRRSS